MHCKNCTLRGSICVGAGGAGMGGPLLERACRRYINRRQISRAEKTPMGTEWITRSRAVRMSTNMHMKAAVVVDRSGEQEGGTVWGVGDGDGILLSLVTVSPGRAG